MATTTKTRRKTDTKLLAVHPGADYATGDVFRGYLSALKAEGHDVGVYNLSTRIDQSGKWLNQIWQDAGSPEHEQPVPADILWHAGGEVVLRALKHEPDWVVVFSGMYLHPDLLILLRRAGQRVALVLSESPYDDPSQCRVAPYAEQIFTNERLSVPVLGAMNPSAEYLPHAYDPDVHWPRDIAPDVPRHDVLFVGSGFAERIELLEAIDWTGIDFGLYGWWELLAEDSPLRPHLRGSIIANHEAASLYRAAKVNLNLYRQSRGFGLDVPRIDRADSLNTRAYELAACGAFQISEARAEVVEMFDWAVPTFGTPAELEALIRACLADEQRRTRAAERARERVLPHTYAERARRLVRRLERLSAAA